MRLIYTNRIDSKTTNWKQHNPFGEFRDGECKIDVIGNDTLPLNYRYPNAVLFYQFEGGKSINDQCMEIMSFIYAYKRLSLPSSHLKLFLSYLPYGRSKHDNDDKGVFFDLLEQHRQLVTPYCIDPHNVDPLHPSAISTILHNAKSVFDLETVIVFPDAGAKKRYEQHYNGYEGITMNKTRNKSGQIEYQPLEKSDIETIAHSHCVIIDDMIDGGSTIRLVSEMLKDAGANKVDAYATHCLQDPLKLKFEHVNILYTTDTIRYDHSDVKDNDYPDNVKITPICQKLFDKHIAKFI